MLTKKARGKLLAVFLLSLAAMLSLVDHDMVRVLMLEVIPGGVRYDLVGVTEVVPKVQSTLIVNSEPVWVSVSQRRALLYSAYLDDRVQPAVVRILAQIHTEDRASEFYCKLSFESNGYNSSVQSNQTITGHVTRMNDFDRTTYEAFFINCPLPTANVLMIPTFVRVYTVPAPATQALAETQALRISGFTTLKQPTFETVGSTTQRPMQYANELAICMRLFNWADWLQTLLFIEFYRFQGVSKFVVYHRSWSPSVAKVIEMYSGQGIVEVVPFPFPPKQKLANGRTDDPLSYDSWDHEQVLQINDCLYRQIGRSKYVIIVDQDEFILPTNASEILTDVLRQVDSVNYALASVSFRNQLFYASWPKANRLRSSDKFSSVDSTKELLLGYFFSDTFVNRYACFHNYYQKSIMRTDAVLRSSIHYLADWVQRYPGGTRYVPLEQAVKFHFRHLPSQGSFFLQKDLGRSYRACVGTDYDLKPNPLQGLKQELLDAVASSYRKVKANSRRSKG